MGNSEEIIKFLKVMLGLAPLLLGGNDMLRCRDIRCTECPLGEYEFVSVSVNIFFQKCSYGGPLDS